MEHIIYTKYDSPGFYKLYMVHVRIVYINILTLRLAVQLL